MNDQSIAKSKRSSVVNCALVGLALLCSLVLASDSVPPVAEDEWEVPIYEVPSFEEHSHDFVLWNECQKIKLVVDIQIAEGATADRLELEEKAVQTLFESRLRAARLFQKESDEDDKKDTKKKEELLQKALQALENPLDNSELFLTITRRLERIGSYDQLWVGVIGIGNAVDLRISYKRYIDVGFGSKWFAEIWFDHSIYMHGYDESFVMQNLSEKADKFILKYLTVNEQACDD